MTGTGGRERREVGDEIKEVMRASSCSHDKDAGFYLGCGMKTWEEFA